MMIIPTTNGMPDVPAQVFEEFLQALGDADVSAELVGRLRETLLEKQTFTERALRAAVIPEEPLP
jgi:hypothetical protein